MPLNDEPQRRAATLLSQQQTLRERLHGLLSAFPICGLYEDEEYAPATFETFVRTICSALAESPRTVLLSELNTRLCALYDSAVTDARVCWAS